MRPKGPKHIINSLRENTQAKEKVPEVLAEVFPRCEFGHVVDSCSRASRILYSLISFTSRQELSLYCPFFNFTKRNQGENEKSGWVIGNLSELVLR
ncbi:hypothetical protein Droror1_Dr00028342, partial [Drosera rotundifolia]